MADQIYALDLGLAKRHYTGIGDGKDARVTWRVVVRTLEAGTYDLTKEYDSSHEAVGALSATLRKLTVETSGE